MKDEFTVGRLSIKSVADPDGNCLVCVSVWDAAGVFKVCTDISEEQFIKNVVSSLSKVYAKVVGVES